jgi:hypothetical protein
MASDATRTPCHGERPNGWFELLKRIYDCFNARDIDGVLAVLADDVAWANGMDGGHVFMGAKQ